jgi:hypothetical protein
MVIVEGPDGSGKTHLVNRLSMALDIPIHPRACTSDNGIDPSTLREWVDRDLYHDHNKGRQIYDRHPLISEPIYGPIIRGQMAEGFADLEWLMLAVQTLRLNTSLMIFCLPPWETVESNVEFGHSPTTDHLKGVLKHNRALYEMYVHRAAIEASVGNVWVWNYTQDYSDLSFDKLAKIVGEIG